MCSLPPSIWWYGTNDSEKAVDILSHGLETGRLYTHMEYALMLGGVHVFEFGIAVDVISWEVELKTTIQPYEIISYTEIVFANRKEWDDRRHKVMQANVKGAA